jgi:hypothetical protein
MRNTLLLLGLAAGLSLGFGLACASSAGAVPIAATAMKEAAAATSPLEPAQYAEYRTRRGPPCEMLPRVRRRPLPLPLVPALTSIK